jgi:hypothetical protein
MIYGTISKQIALHLAVLMQDPWNRGVDEDAIEQWLFDAQYDPSIMHKTASKT